MEKSSLEIKNEKIAELEKQLNSEKERQLFLFDELDKIGGDTTELRKLLEPTTDEKSTDLKQADTHNDANISSKQNSQTKNELKQTENKESKSKIEKTEKEFDTKAVIKKINERIAKEENTKGAPLEESEKKNIAQEIFLQAKENSQKEKLKSSNVFIKTEKWWQDLEKTKWGKTFKVALGAAFLGTATIASGALIGIAPSPIGVAKRLTMRIAGATGLNMALTSGLLGKVRNIFKKEGGENTEKTEKEGENGEKKENKIFNLKNLGNVAMLGGIGVSYLLSGGVVAGITAGGIAIRKLSGYLLDKKIKEKEEAIKNLEKKEEIKNPNDGFDINKFVNNLDKISEEHEKVVNSIKWLKRTKSIIGGAATIGVGVATMAVLEIEHRVETQKQTSEKWKKDLEEGIKKQEEEKIEAIKKEIEKKLLETTTVRKGEGIENAFIRQIESDKVLAEKLGFKGDINDAKALHQFAGREAHIVAMKEGYVDNAGHEVRVAETDKIAYQIREENGKIFVDEKEVSTGKTLETHTEGDKFEENIDKYEYSDGKDHRLDNQQIGDTHTVETEEQKSEFVGPEKNIANDEVTEYGDNLNTGEHELSNQNNTENSTTNSENIPRENLVSVLRNIHSKDYTEETWKNAPENIEHISLSQFKEIEDLNKYNLRLINRQISEMSTDHSGIDKIIQKVNSRIFEGNADAFTGKIEETDVIYRPLHTYINKLIKVTGLKPIEETPLSKGETTANFIERAMMRASHDGNLNKITLENTSSHETLTPEVKTTIPEQIITPKVNNNIAEPIKENLTQVEKNTEIIIPYSNNYEHVDGMKVVFSYDDSGNPTRVNLEGNLKGFSENELFKDDYKKELLGWSNQNGRDSQITIDKAVYDERNLYMHLATYENLIKDASRAKESLFLKNLIEKEINNLSSYGNIINYEKLPKEFQK